MRLTPTEINGIISSVNNFIKNRPAELYLYGSRTDDSKKGGDIDLLLLSDQSNLNLEKHTILVAIKNEIGDQKIDLKISTFKTAKQDNFINLILPSAMLLYRW